MKWPAYEKRFIAAHPKLTPRQLIIDKCNLRQMIRRVKNYPLGMEKRDSSCIWESVRQLWYIVLIRLRKRQCITSVHVVCSLYRSGGIGNNKAMNEADESGREIYSRGKWSSFVEKKSSFQKHLLCEEQKFAGHNISRMHHSQMPILEHKILGCFLPAETSVITMMTSTDFADDIWREVWSRLERMKLPANIWPVHGLLIHYLAAVKRQYKLLCRTCTL